MSLKISRFVIPTELDKKNRATIDETVASIINGAVDMMRALKPFITVPYLIIIPPNPKQKEDVTTKSQKVVLLSKTAIEEVLKVEVGVD
jgi:hypothetical protein